MTHPRRFAIGFAAALVVTTSCSDSTAVRAGESPPIDFGRRPAAPIVESTSDSRAFPIGWRVGDIDPRFEVSKQEFYAAIERATQLWESTARRDLFVYDADRGMPIQLIYDQRQETVLQRRDAQKTLDELRGQLADADRVAKAKLKERNELVGRLNAAGDEYAARVTEHNRVVDEWNARGGAPEVEAAKLREESESLTRMKAEIARGRDELDAMERELSPLRSNADALRRRFNAAVDAYNKSFAGKIDRAGEFSKSTMGKDRIVDRAIAIYEVESLESMTVVLAHEFGHAIGLGHVAGSGAMMSEAYTGRPGVAPPLTLTDRDRKALRECLAKYPR